MRILWVKMGGLWPATTGGRVRSLNTISQLARGHQVTVITTHGHGDDPHGLKQQLAHCERVISVPYAVPKRGSAAFAASVAGSWFSHYPVDLWKWRVRDCQADACRRADLTIAVSDDDKDRLAELGAGIRAVSIPTGVDTEYFKPRGVAQVPARLVFSGSMDWHPNEDAVRYFVDTILPRIRAEVPATSFTI